MNTDRYNPIPLDVTTTHEQWMRQPGYAKAFADLEDEFAALNALLGARQQAGLTQEQVADRMGVAQASVARLESSAGSRKHSPSLATLRRYADAVGCDLHLNLTPKHAKPVSHT